MAVILEFVAEALALIANPKVIEAGIDVANLIGKARAVLDANAAPDDVDWAALDQQVNDLRARLAVDPA